MQIMQWFNCISKGLKYWKKSEYCLFSTVFFITLVLVLRVIAQSSNEISYISTTSLFMGG
tara:strand:- start:402 stop:581 length:180 start_codon:yes stop_codon:yes gene_type:complete